MEVNGQLHVPAGKDPPVPVGEEPEWAPRPNWKQWREKKNIEIEPRSSSPQPSHYTD